MDDRKYKVGYGKPPKHTQFKKGQSGNPKGRPTGAKGLKTDLREEFNERVTINEDSKSVTLTKQRLIVKQLTNKAMKGDMHATHKALSLALSLLDSEDDQARGPEPLSESDEAILKAFVERHWRQSNDE